MNKQLTQSKSSAPVNLWSLIGGAALVAVAFIVAKNFPSMRRYLKIERM